MKIKTYIVTYNNDDVLKRNLEKLYSSDLLSYDYSVHIINNYSKKKINNKLLNINNII